MRKIIFLFCVVYLCGCSPIIPNKNTTLPGEQTASPSYGGTLKIHSYNFDPFNPLFTKSDTNRQVLMLIYDFLIICDNSMLPQAELASDFSVSDDGLCWTINIRQGVKWNDGTDFTPQDVAATLEAVKNSPHNSPYKENLLNVISIQALPDSVVITLAAPEANFINRLEIPILKADECQNINIQTPIGTGCYQLTERTHRVIYLISNPSGRYTPYIETVEVHLLPDKSTSIYAFDAKETDVVKTDMLSRGQFSGYSQRKAVEYNSALYNFLAFNTDNKYLSDINIRRAIAHTIDKKRILEEVLLSCGVISDTFLHPKWYYYNDNVPKYEHNAALAADILSQNNIGTADITLKIMVNEDNPIKVSVAEQIAQSIKSIGINTSVQQVSWENFRALVADGAYDMYLGEINYSNDINPKYVVPNTQTFLSLMEQLQIQTTQNGKQAVYHQLQQQYATDLPAVPLYFNWEAILLSDKVKGEITPLRNDIFYNIHQWYI